MSKGKLVIFSAPSGAGKTTIVKHLLKQGFDFEFSISATTRPKRVGETDGKDYYFLSVEDFERRIENSEFLEWEEVYAGSYYGTLKSEVERIRDNGKHVLFDVDVVGGINIKRYYGDDALAVFIQPPSVDELKKRLISRSTDSSEVIQNRVDKAFHELSFATEFDVIIVNDDLETAFKDTEETVKQFLEE
jgi:guanylate kinase